MNAGLANLDTLKKYLLAKGLQPATDFDAILALIGKGVAGALENFCNRKFARATGTTEILAADRCQFLLSRFPLESVTAIDLKITEADGWVAKTVNDFVRTIDLQSGLVYLPDNADAGDYSSQLRFTYSGGFFWEQLEPTDNGYPTAVPNGANLLPDDLKEAWLIQCEIVWKMRDKLGKDITRGEQKGRGPMFEINDLALAPLVKQMLGQYVRYNLV